MGGLSITHLLLIGGIVLLVFGPGRIAGVGKGLGEAIRGFKKGLGGDEIDVTPTKTEQLDANQQKTKQHSDS